MRKIVSLITLILAAAALPVFGQVEPQAKTLKLHNIFDSDMVLQRDKPIKIWGWGKPGAPVHVKFGDDTTSTVVAAAAPVDVYGEEATYAGKGRWEVILPARPASIEPETLFVVSEGEDVKLPNIVIGDVWVMHGQSNMAFPLGKTNGRPLARLANRPHLRLYSITGNEQGSLQDDIRPETVTTGGWVVSSPETAAEFSAIGYVFGSNIQQALGIPIGVIKNARGGASIESMVPAYKFDEHPLSKRYADLVRKKMAEFDIEVTIDEIWDRQKARAESKGEPVPPRPKPEDVRSWSIPGKSPGSMASVYNGMFGAFKGIHIKGVLFHQGYNNQMGANLRPDFYRVLVRLMIEGWREEFDNPEMPVAVVGFNAGGTTQNERNFEALSHEGGPWIREAQRLGVADVESEAITAFLPAYDVQVKGLHPGKKREHGWRSALWALEEVYSSKRGLWGYKVAQLTSAEPQGDVFALKFDKRVKTDDSNFVLEGFSIAGEDRKFYRAYARHAPHEGNYWKNGDREIHVWSPLVKEPVAVRYAWANSPMGNLTHDGDQDLPFPSFRTDDWKLPINPDFDERAMSRGTERARSAEADERLEYRLLEEARMAMEIHERLKTFGK